MPEFNWGYCSNECIISSSLSLFFFVNSSSPLIIVIILVLVFSMIAVVGSAASVLCSLTYLSDLSFTIFYDDTTSLIILFLSSSVINMNTISLNLNFGGTVCLPFSKLQPFSCLKIQATRVQSKRSGFPLLTTTSHCTFAFSQQNPKKRCHCNKHAFY